MYCSFPYVYSTQIEIQNTSVLKGRSCYFPANNSSVLPGNYYSDLCHHQLVHTCFCPSHAQNHRLGTQLSVGTLSCFLTMWDIFVLLNGVVVFHRCVVVHCANTNTVGMESHCLSKSSFPDNCNLRKVPIVALDHKSHLWNGAKQDLSERVVVKIGNVRSTARPLR